MATKFIKSNEDGSTQIERDGLILICPFVPPLVVPSQSSVIGERTLQIIKTPCSSNCPHFSIQPASAFSGRANFNNVYISCTGTKSIYSETN